MRQLFARIVTILWAFILVGLLLPVSNGSPSLHTFLRPNLWWLVAAGALITFLFFIVSLKSDQYTHSHVKSRMGALIKMLLLVVPAPFIVAFSKAEYGTDGLANRLMMKRVQEAENPNSKVSKAPEAAAPQAETSKVADAPKAAAPEAAAKDSIYQTDLMELLYAPESFYGRRVKTTGMMFHGSPIPEAYLYCFRYVMVCCAADAIPVGVFIDKSDTITIKKDAWYEIEGTVHPDSLDGYFILKMDEAVMQPVQKPMNPWLYPR